VAESLGRVADRTVRARHFLPPCDVATMDGFAIRSVAFEPDGGPAPRTFRVVARSFPGDRRRRSPRVGRESAVEIFTGAPMPAGADAVVRSEECRCEGQRVTVDRPVARGRNVALRGEDFRPGRTIVRASSTIRPWHVAALVANDVRTIRVRCRPRIGLLSTGSEIEGSRPALRSGRTRDSAKPMLRSMLLELGAVPVDLGVAPDRAVAIRRRLRVGLVRCDALITTGGSSVGDRDVVPQAVDGLPGVHWVADRLRMRPGSSTRVAVVGRRPVFLLSGPPVAAFAGFVTLVEPFLRSLGATPPPSSPSVSAVLGERIAHARGVRELVRVRLSRTDGGPRVTVVERHGASRLSSLTGADGLLVLEEGRGDYRKGERVPIRPLGE
jgi:molybdopterin molybdotransferase